MLENGSLLHSPTEAVVLDAAVSVSPFSMEQIGNSLSTTAQVGAWRQPLMINVCGRTLNLVAPSVTMPDLQALLQDELGVPDQIFELCDCSGTPILLDSDLVEAVRENRLPLSATLSDTSIHFIENRREELAHMQWKLVRDQHNGAHGRMQLFGRTLHDFDKRLEEQKADSLQTITLLRNEFAATVDKVEGKMRSEMKQLGERIAGVAQLVQIERNMREVGLEQVNKSMQSVRDTIDSDRTVVQEGSTILMGHIDSVRQFIDAERRNRELLAEKMQSDARSMSERIDSLMGTMQASVAEYARNMELSADKTTQVMENSGKKIDQSRQDMMSTLESAHARIKLLEDRSSLLETDLGDAKSNSSAQVQRLLQRHDTQWLLMETLRFDGSQHGLNVQALAQKLRDMDAAITEQREQLEKAAHRDREARDMQLQSFRQAIKSTPTADGLQSISGSLAVPGPQSAAGSLAVAAYEQAEKAGEKTVVPMLDVQVDNWRNQAQSTSGAAKRNFTPEPIRSAPRTPSAGSAHFVQRNSTSLPGARTSSPRHVFSAPARGATVQHVVVGAPSSPNRAGSPMSSMAASSVVTTAQPMAAHFMVQPVRSSSVTVERRPRVSLTPSARLR